MGVATINTRIHFVVFICLDNGQSIIEDTFSCEESQILEGLFTSNFIVSVVIKSFDQMNDLLAILVDHQ